MREWQSQSHVRWYCKYHVVFVPKYRKKVIFGRLRRGIVKILRELCEQHGVELVEGHAMSDHVHLCLSIPPKFSVANTVGFLKGKSAIQIHRRYLGKQRKFTGFHFLGAWLLREHSWLGRGDDPCVHQESGGRGDASGPPAAGGLEPPSSG